MLLTACGTLCCAQLCLAWRAAGTWYVPLAEQALLCPPVVPLCPRKPPHRHPTAPTPAALGYSSHWQPTQEPQDRQEQAQAADGPACSGGITPPTEHLRPPVDSSEDSVHTQGRALHPMTHAKRAAPACDDSPCPKRSHASPATSPVPAAAAMAAAAAAAAATPTSRAFAAAAGSSIEGPLQQHTLPPTWQQVAAPFAVDPADSLTAQDTLLWQLPSLQQLLTHQHSTDSMDATMQAALRLLGWGSLPAAAGLAAAPSLGPAAYQLLALHGADLAFMWHPQPAAQQHPAWWAQLGAWPPPQYGVAGQQPAPTVASGFVHGHAAGMRKPPFNFWAQQPAAGAVPGHMQQAQRQHFAFGLPAAAADDHLGAAAAAAAAVAAELAFSPAPLAQPPPLPGHWPADRNTSSPSIAALAQPQSARTVVTAAPAAVQPQADAPRSISFPPRSLPWRSPFAAGAAAAPLATPAAPAPTPVPSPLPAKAAAAVAGEPPAWDVAPVSPSVQALLSLPDKAPLNDDLLGMYVSWHEEGASLHL